MAEYSIEYKQFRFGITALEPLILPVYKGSTFRGRFGYAFKRVVCVIRDKECPDCILKDKCIYSYVFETPPPSDTKIMRKYKAASLDVLHVGKGTGFGLGKYGILKGDSER